jgi:lysine 6-dehydrogenase
MTHRYAVLGAGRQGVAAAYDLAVHGDAAAVTLADRDGGRVSAALERLRALVPRVPFGGATVDAADEDAVAALLGEHDAALSAASYTVNAAVTRAAIAARCHLNDLGGNTAVVRDQLALDAAARAAGVSVVPDCGLAPGLGNLLVGYGLERFPAADSARVRCGGLPQAPKGPLDYMLVFSVEGLTNEYTGEAEILRDGERLHVPTLTGREELEFAPPVGPAEAFYTSGGISTLAEALAGRLRNLDYKTVRYPGHVDRVRTLYELGYLDLEPVLLGTGPVVPRDLTHALWERALSYPGEPDLVVLRVEVEGPGENPQGAGDRRLLRLELIDKLDPATGFSAMERTTAFPATMVTILQARGAVPPGAHHLQDAVPLATYVADLATHGLRLAERWIE